MVLKIAEEVLLLVSEIFVLRTFRPEINSTCQILVVKDFRRKTNSDPFDFSKE